MRELGTIMHQHGSRADTYVFGNGESTSQKDIQRIKFIARHAYIDEIQFKKMELRPMVLQNSKSDTAIIMMGNNLQDAEARVLLRKHKKWLADGSTKLWKIRRWQKDPQNLHLRLLLTAETGPIYLDCKDFHRFFRQK